MTKQEKISKLIKIADLLDRNDMPDEAKLVDEMILKENNPELEIEIPEEEYDLLQQVYQSLGQSIKF